MEGHPLWLSHKQQWGQGFILLLAQAVVLPKLDAGSDSVEPASEMSLMAGCLSQSKLFINLFPILTHFERIITGQLCDCVKISVI